MAFGLRVTNDDGRSMLLDGSMRFASYLGTVTTLSGGGAAGVPRPILPGATPLIVPRQMVYVSGEGGNTSPQISLVKSVGFSGNTLSYQTQEFANMPKGYSNGVIDVFSVQGAASMQGYGISIFNGSNFAGIDDTSYCGVVTYINTINITNGWWGVPSEIVNLGNYIVFARWDNTEYPLYFDRNNNGISLWSGFSSAGGSVQQGTVNNVQIVIVSCGFSPAPPASGYGLTIRNAAGQITYSSRYAPVAWTDAYYSMPGYVETSDASGDRVQWVGPTGNVAYPMVPLCTLGFGRGDYTRSVNNIYKFRRCLLSGFKMSGRNITNSRAKPTSEMEVYQSPRAASAAVNLPCIDAAYYF